MTQSADARERLKFREFELSRFPNGQCRAFVRVDWTQGRSFSGEADGNQTLEGEVRAAAQATLEAVMGATDGPVELELRGAKALRVFDAWLVVVMVRAWVEGHAVQLLGAYPCPDEDTPRGAVLAALDATNRILTRHLVH